MRKLLLTSCSIAFLAAAGAAMAADDVKPAEPVKAAAASATTDKAEAKKAARANPHCVRETGTRIVLTKDQCSSAPGHSFSGDELMLTGEQDTASALKKLDPSLR